MTSKRSTTTRHNRSAHTISPDGTARLSHLHQNTWLIKLFVFGSGCCALVYQTAWQREFRLIFGASTGASAAVIAVFMSGLGLGSWLLGQTADRHRNPVRFFSALEGTVGLFSLATPMLLSLVRGVYLSLGGQAVLGDATAFAVRIFLGGLVLMPPTLASGGSLGAMARAAELDGVGVRTKTATLYGLNTLGAVFGCIVSTFWLLETFGTRASIWIAATLNLLIAVAAFLLGNKCVVLEPSRQQSQNHRDDDHAREPVWAIWCAAACAGFVFFLMELVWFRMLGPILGGTVYAFGLVLAVALAGIGIGGVTYGFVSHRARPTVRTLTIVCLCEAAAIAIPFILGDRVPLLADAMRPLPGSPLGSYLLGWTTVTLVTVLPASLAAGVQFPTLLDMVGGGRSRVASHVGLVFLANSVGGVVGALAGGFGMLPVLGALGCWKLAVLLLLGLSLLVATFCTGTRHLMTVGLGAAMIAGTLLSSEGPTAVWRHSEIGVGRAQAPLGAGTNAIRAWINDKRRSVTWEAEGVESSVAIQSIAALSFVVNGKVDGNARNDAPVQVMGGLLGALIHPNAHSSAVIGLGTGSTAGWLAAVPTMQRTDVIELEPAVAHVATLCGPVNHSAMTNPVVHVITGDAREVLTTSRERYDVIFSEPSNPYRAGVASLFTKEFYAAVDSRLNDGGIFLQWLQGYDIDDSAFSTVIVTLGAVFPQVELWQVHQADVILVASRHPLRLNAPILRQRITQEPFASALRNAWRALELEDVLARFVAGPGLAREMRLREPAVNTDDKNRLEFAFARTLSSTNRFDVALYRRRAAALNADRPALAGSVAWDRVERQRTAIYVLAGVPPPDDPAVSQAGRSRAAALANYVSGHLSEAAQAFEIQHLAVEGAVETSLMAEGLADAGDPRAVPYIRTLSNIQQTEAAAATARLAFRLGEYELAGASLVSAFIRYRTDPWPSQVSMSRALALADELTLQRPDLSSTIFEALSRPFSVAALDESRQIVRLSVESHSGKFANCVEALAAFEPHIPWRSDVLRYRANCYTRTFDARARQARDDLAQFERGS